MGDTQIQYSFLLEVHRRRHAYKQLGFSVVPLPEARKVTSHCSILGKYISTGDATGSESTGNEGIYPMWAGAWLKPYYHFRVDIANWEREMFHRIISSTECHNAWDYPDDNSRCRSYEITSLHGTLGSVEKFSKQESDENFFFFLHIFFHQAAWLQTKVAITLFGACWWETPDFVRGGEKKRNICNTF